MCQVPGGRSHHEGCVEVHGGDGRKMLTPYSVCVCVCCVHVILSIYQNAIVISGVGIEGTVLKEGLPKFYDTMHD